MERSKHEEMYFAADKQKDYEPLLKDPTTPESIITDIVDRITLLPLKILALNHPNISERSQRYLIDKADRKDYLKDIVENFLKNPKPLNQNNWLQLRQFYNKAERFDICVMELLEEQASFLTSDKLDVIFNSLGDAYGNHRKGLKKEKNMERYFMAVVDHKNFDVNSLDGEIHQKGRIIYEDFLKQISASRNKDVIYGKLYEITGNDAFLPQEAKDIFLF